MTKRPNENIAEKGKEFHQLENEPANLKAKDFAFLDEAEKILESVSNLAELLTVIDLEAMKRPGNAFNKYMPVSHGLREFGNLLSNMTMDASDKIIEGKRALDLD